MKILVIGAGPTGLTAALQLAHLNQVPRIVERREEPSALSRAVGIMPVTLDKLRPLGAADPIQAEAMPLRRLTISKDGAPLFELDNRHNEYRDRCLVGLPQNRTEEIIRDVLHQHGVAVEYGLSVETVTTDTEKATIKFSDGTEDTFDWVIAADGIFSNTRQQLGIDYPGIDLSEEWSIADVDLSGDFDPEQVRIDIQGDGGMLQMMLPIEKQRARMVSSTPDTLAVYRWPITIENVRRTGKFTISVRQAVSYVKNRVLLAGDAAHCHSPLGGKGMNLGIDDAVNAAKAIAEDTVADYSEARHEIGKRVLNTTEGARKVVTSKSPLASTLISAAGFTVRNLKPVQKLFMERLINL